MLGLNNREINAFTEITNHLAHDKTDIFHDDLSRHKPHDTQGYNIQHAFQAKTLPIGPCYMRRYCSFNLKMFSI